MLRCWLLFFSHLADIENGEPANDLRGEGYKNTGQVTTQKQFCVSVCGGFSLRGPWIPRWERYSKGLLPIEAVLSKTDRIDISLLRGRLLIATKSYKANVNASWYHPGSTDDGSAMSLGTSAPLSRSGQAGVECSRGCSE